jgi:hypothetical protein
MRGWSGGRGTFREKGCRSSGKQNEASLLSTRQYGKLVSSATPLALAARRRCNGRALERATPAAVGVSSAVLTVHPTDMPSHWPTSQWSPQ